MTAPSPFVAQAIAQGHGPTITDPDVLRMVAAIVRQAQERRAS